MGNPVIILILFCLELQPNFQIASKGISVFFVILAPEKLYWKHNGGHIPQNAISVKINDFNYLKITEVIESNSGKYSVYDVDKNEFIDEAVLKYKSSGVGKCLEIF